MKNEILNYLKTDRSYDNGVKLYHKHGLNMALKKQLNVQPESDYMKGILFEQFREMIEMTPVEFSVLMAHPVVKSKVVAEPVLTKQQEFDLLFAEAKKAFEDGNLLQVRELLTKAEQIDVKNGRKLDLNLDQQKLADDFNFQNDPKKVPDGVKMTIKLRDEFPFLKSPDCPPVLKVLVQDKLNAYDAYKEAHEALFTAETEDELLQAASDTVENYLENRAIWDELNYYKENNEILGKHPIFEEMKLQEEVDAMVTADLFKEHNNVKSNITKTKKSIENSPNDPKIYEWSQKLELLEKKKLMLEKRIGIPDKPKKEAAPKANKVASGAKKAAPKTNNKAVKK